MERWNHDKILAHFGGAASLHTQLLNAGYEVSERTVYMWGYRKRIPGDWMPTLIKLAFGTDHEWISPPKAEDIF